ncbi:hypothetical protein PC128_g22066 [Phytophthora cactorum]|nr:hypothetical protein PC128_g22066 [Phytophthora cactorum]
MLGRLSLRSMMTAVMEMTRRTPSATDTAPAISSRAAPISNSGCPAGLCVSSSASDSHDRDPEEAKIATISSRKILDAPSVSPDLRHAVEHTPLTNAAGSVALVPLLIGQTDLRTADPRQVDLTYLFLLTQPVLRGSIRPAEGQWHRDLMRQRPYYCPIHRGGFSYATLNHLMSCAACNIDVRSLLSVEEKLRDECV